jgi:hypothetical protein
MAFLFYKPQFFQNFSIERAAFENSSFVEPWVRGRRPKNCKSLCKTNRVLQEVQSIFLGGYIYAHG